MKKYLFWRVVKAIISIFVVVGIVIAMVYTMIPTTNVFKEDNTYNKLRGNEKFVYLNTMLERLGYQDYLTLGEMCSMESEDSAACQKKDTPEREKVVETFKAKGYEIHTLTGGGKLKGQVVAIRKYGTFELVSRYFVNMFQFDNKNKVQDENNPFIEENRGYSIKKDHNGLPALVCIGCEYKYQLYFNGKFPFIHQNFLKINFGISYPTNAGIPTLDVITNGQGSQKSVDMVYPSGVEGKGAEDLHSVKYLHVTNHLIDNKFPDKYADAKMNYIEPSMVSTSYIFGIISLVLSYMIALPAGVAMARNKGKFIDKAGIVYINLLIALPSLAFIYIVKLIGTFWQLPDKFPQLGAFDIRSYILPLVILTILGTPGIMIWIRRYMIDQSSSDYVKFARSKGLSRKEISRNHILKNAMIPIVNGIPASIILAIGGAVITEAVFAIPGMGKMLPDAIRSSNNNMVITLTFIFTALSIFSVILGDILLTIIDPRISLNAKKGDL